MRHLEELSDETVNPITKLRDININIWLDQSSMENNLEELKKIPGINICSTSDLIKNFMASKIFSDEEKSNFLKCLLFEYLPPANYAAIADFERVVLLIMYGGLYVDTDVGLKMNFATFKEKLKQNLIHDDNYAVHIFIKFLKITLNKTTDEIYDDFLLNTESRQKTISMIAESYSDKWNDFLMEKYKEKYSLIPNDDLTAQIGIFHTPCNNNIILAAANHPVLINLLKNMVNTELNLINNEHINLKEFYSKQHAMLAKKCLYVLKPEDILSNEESQRYCRGIMFVSSNKNNALIRDLTIEIGPGLIDKQTE